MSIFAGIEQAQNYGGGQYIEPGAWELEVSELKVFESSQHPGRMYFAAECRVVSTTCETSGQGSVVTWLVNMTQSSSLGNLKGFAVALDPNLSDDDITQDYMDLLVSAEQPAAGIKVRADAANIKTKAGNDFTKVVWSSIQ